METDNQNDNKPWLWKKGQSGNLAGRPKGKTLKEYAKDFLSKMNEEERDEFMHGLPKEVIWKMAEGNPATENEHKIEFLPKPIADVPQNPSVQENSEPTEEN